MRLTRNSATIPILKLTKQSLVRSFVPPHQANMQVGETVFLGVIAPDAQPQNEERHCPKCNAHWVKTAPTLAQVRTAIQQAISGQTTSIKNLSKDASFGYCGSIVTGKVGNPKKSHFGLEPDIRGEC
jgi:hypothetical protein